MQNRIRQIPFAMLVAAGLLTGGTAWSESMQSPSSAGQSTSHGAGTGAMVTEGARVTVEYFIAVPDDPKEAYKDVTQFVQGQHEILPAFEKQVAGMKEGEQKEFQLSPDEGFGPYDERRKQTVEKHDLPPEIKEGDVVGDKEGRAATVQQLSSTTAVLDFNHPLAGKPLTVSLKVLKVEEPAS